MSRQIVDLEWRKCAHDRASLTSNFQRRRVRNSTEGDGKVTSRRREWEIRVPHNDGSRRGTGRREKPSAMRFPAVVEDAAVVSGTDDIGVLRPSNIFHT